MNVVINDSKIEKSSILKEIETIKREFKNGADYQALKKRFFRVVDQIKLYEIKSDEILNEMRDIRRAFVDAWRPKEKQYSITSGVFLWSAFVIAGIILSAFFWFFPIYLIVPHLLNIIGLVFGWLSINIGIHNLGHYVAGKIVGIGFDSWVIRQKVFQWALIIEYKSYLKAGFRKRQVLHVSGPACTLGTPWVMFLITFSPVMFIIAIYMIVGSLPVIIRGIWDYGRIYKERKLKIENKKLKVKSI